MAILTTSGFESLSLTLDKLANIPEGILDDMLNAEADVILAEQKKNIASLWKGKYSTGISADALVKAKPRTGSNSKYGKSRYITIYFDGKRNRSKGNTKNVVIGFVNEYGKHGQAPRPAFRPALENKADEAQNAAAKVYEAFIEQQQ
jgi:hypothetical protein